MRATVGLRGPIATDINADTSVIKGYTSGILNPSECTINLNHSVTTIGYGYEGGELYFIARNSWGVNWGEQGYFRIFGGENTNSLESDR